MQQQVSVRVTRVSRPPTIPLDIVTPASPTTHRAGCAASVHLHSLQRWGAPPPAASSAERERRGFERAVVPWLNNLRASALRLCRSRAEADDLVQETVLRAWRFWPRYTERDTCRAWLQRILANTFVSGRRRAARERTIMALVEQDLRLDQPPLAADAGDGGLDDRMTGSLSALGDEQRKVLWLVDVQDRSYREAAHELGLPIGTVMSRLHRARAALRRELDDRAASARDRAAEPWPRARRWSAPAPSLALDAAG